MKKIMILGLLIALTNLQACFPLVATGVVVGSLAATDRRTAGTQLEDKTIEFKAASHINAKYKEGVHVNVNSYNRHVLITGEAVTAQMKTDIEQIVANVENVAAVVNEIEVQGPASLTSRSNDTLITGKVKALLIDAKDIFANAYKVTTERGVVYLQGRVTQREGDRAAEIASHVGGVAKVVKLFDYIGEEEFKTLSTTPAPAENKQLQK